MSDEIQTKLCLDCKQDLPVWDFYCNKRGGDGYSAYCKECDKKRAAQAQARRRAANVAAGLPYNYSQKQAQEATDDYITRHEANRLTEQQALQCLEEPCTENEGGLGFIEEKGFRDLTNQFYRQRQRSYQFQVR